MASDVKPPALSKQEVMRLFKEIPGIHSHPHGNRYQGISNQGNGNQRKGYQGNKLNLSYDSHLMNRKNIRKILASCPEYNTATDLNADVDLDNDLDVLNNLDLDSSVYNDLNVSNEGTSGNLSAAKSDSKQKRSKSFYDNFSNDLDHDLEPGDLMDLTPEEVDIDDLLREQLDISPVTSEERTGQWYMDSDEDTSGQEQDQG